MIMVYLCNGMMIIIIILVIIICIYIYITMFLLVQLISIYIYCIRDTMIVAIVYSATKGICDYIYMLYVYMIL